MKTKLQPFGGIKLSTKLTKEAAAMTEKIIHLNECMASGLV